MILLIFEFDQASLHFSCGGLILQMCVEVRVKSDNEQFASAQCLLIKLCSGPLNRLFP